MWRDRVVEELWDGMWGFEREWKAFGDEKGDSGGWLY